MTTQPTLWGHSDTRTNQPELFEGGPRESGLSCQCGRPLVETPSGYLVCPRGCGKLKLDTRRMDRDHQTEDES